MRDFEETFNDLNWFTRKATIPLMAILVVVSTLFFQESEQASLRGKPSQAESMEAGGRLVATGAILLMMWFLFAFTRSMQPPLENNGVCFYQGAGAGSYGSTEDQGTGKRLVL